MKCVLFWAAVVALEIGRLLRRLAGMPGRWLRRLMKWWRERRT